MKGSPLSTEVNEMFETLIEGLDRGLSCDPHDWDGIEHEAVRLFEMECPDCGWADAIAVCAEVYHNTVARKEDEFVSCDDCGTYFKPFDLIMSALKVNL